MCRILYSMTFTWRSGTFSRRSSFPLIPARGWFARSKKSTRKLCDRRSVRTLTCLATSLLTPPDLKKQRLARRFDKQCSSATRWQSLSKHQATGSRACGCAAHLRTCTRRPGHAPTSAAPRSSATPLLDFRTTSRHNPPLLFPASLLSPSGHSTLDFRTNCFK